MQLLDRVPNCNGCAACIVGCKYGLVKMVDREDGYKGEKQVPLVGENSCSKCNACVLFCPIYNPVEIPEFDEWYEYDEKYSVRNRDIVKAYREAMHSVREGKHTEFTGTLCEIAGIKSLLGDKIPQNLILKPMVCDAEKRNSEECCKECIFYEK